MLLKRLIQTAPKTVTDTKKWQIFVGVCIERSPIVSAIRTETEERYFNFMQQLEKENSLLSHHEMLQIEDKLLAQKMAEPDFDPEELGERRTFTAQDIEDKAKSDLKAFETGPIETDADANKDYSSTNRCLREKLYFLVDQVYEGCTPPPVTNFTYPSTLLREDETLRESCDRLLSEVSSPQGQFRTTSNAPASFISYLYPDPIREQTSHDGAKVFYFKSNLLSPFEPNKDRIKDYLWLTREEMKQRTRPIVFKSHTKFLLR